jgi:antitoxin HicB
VLAGAAIIIAAGLHIFSLEAFKRSGITKSELGRRIGKDEKEVRRILDPRHRTKLATLTEALRMLGQQLVIGVRAAA